MVCGTNPSTLEETKTDDLCGVEAVDDEGYEEVEAEEGADEDEPDHETGAPERVVVRHLHLVRVGFKWGSV